VDFRAEGVVKAFLKSLFGRTPAAGEKWSISSKKSCPFPDAVEDTTVIVIEVVDGWVRYRFVGTSSVFTEPVSYFTGVYSWTGGTGTCWNVSRMRK
jgi:hypothetical protein